MSVLAPSPRARQHGATLIVGLIMLVLITIMVLSAFKMSGSNLQAVGNMQTRNEAVAAGNRAIELLMSSDFANAPATQVISVDIDKDGANDFDVTFEKPVCISASKVAGASSPPSSLSLGTAFSKSVGNQYETVFDLNANVSASGTGTTADGVAVRVHQGVRRLLSEAEYKAACA